MRITRVLIFAWLLTMAAAASGHGAADNHLVIVVTDARVRLNMVVGDRVLGLADQDGNGHIALAELTAGRDRLSAWFDGAVKISSAGVPAPRVVFSDLTTDLDGAERHGAVDHARFLRTLVFDRAPNSLDVDVRALAERVPGLKVTVVDTQSGERRRLIAFESPQSLTL